MRVLLIQTTLEIIEESYHDAINASYPLGLAYLHAVLERADHTVESLNLSELPLAQNLTTLSARIGTARPDVIGLQILTPNRVSSSAIMDFFRKQDPTIKIVVGGIHVTELYRQILAQHPYAVAILGEGEETFCALLEAIKNEADLNSIAGVAFNLNGKIVVTAPRPAIQDLDSIPFPKHEAFLSQSDIYASLLTSRGCPFTCSFCAVARREMRLRSVRNVVDEIEHISRTFPNVQYVRIWDDQFFFKNSRVIEICNEIVRRRIDLRFICMGRLKPCSRELVLALERAGFVQVLFGLESGARTVVERCGKGIRIEDAARTLRLFSDSCIDVSMFLIVGLEGETVETILETASAVQQLQQIKYFPGWSNVGIATVYPGTDLYQRALSTGTMSEQYWLTDGSVPLFEVEHSASRLCELLDLLEQHIDPSRILEDEEAFRLQRHLIPQILNFVIQWLARGSDPYWDRRELGKLPDLIANAVRELEHRGDLRIVLGHSMLSNTKQTGTIKLPHFSRVPGKESVYSFDIQEKEASDAMVACLAHVARNGPASIFMQLCQEFERQLSEHWAGKQATRSRMVAQLSGPA